MTYYIEHEGKIVLFDTDKSRLQETLSFMPQYGAKEILETERPIVDFKFADTPQYQSEEQAKANAERVAELKKLLADTDYIASKIAEGAATKEEYSEQIVQRQEWRAQINVLEGGYDGGND